MYLYYKNALGKYTFLGEATLETAQGMIVNHVHKLNPNYRIYYIRQLGPYEDGSFSYDVGSHSEFFYLYKEARKDA